MELDELEDPFDFVPVELEPLLEAEPLELLEVEPVEVEPLAVLVVSLPALEPPSEAGAANEPLATAVAD